MFERLSKHIAQITLNRPEALNALNQVLVEELDQDVQQAATEEDLRVLLFTGTGTKAFCAGADLKERALMSLDETRFFLKKLNQLFDQIAAFPVPTIAYLNGIAFGGGLELALTCDMRVAALHAQMGLTEVSWGIIPGAGGTQRLGKVLGYAKAAELIFSARKLNAEEALHIGLINQISEPLTLAEQIAQGSTLSLRMAKEAMRTGNEAAAYEQVLHSPDRLEGLRAFAEKRAARF